MAEGKSNIGATPIMGELLDGIRHLAAVKETHSVDTKALVSKLLEGIKQLVDKRPVGPRSRSRGTATPLEQIQCFFCKEMGHYRNDCGKYRQHQADLKKNPLN